MNTARLRWMLRKPRLMRWERRHRWRAIARATDEVVLELQAMRAKWRGLLH